MGATENYDLRYPELTDPPNGPQAFQNLAEDTDGALSQVLSAANSNTTSQVNSAKSQLQGQINTLSGNVSTTMSNLSNLTNRTNLLGIAGWHTRTTNKTFGATETLIADVVANVVNGRTYLVQAQFGHRCNAIPATGVFRFRATFNGSAPTTSSTQIGRGVQTYTETNIPNTLYMEALFRATYTGLLIVGLTGIRGAGNSGTITLDTQEDACDLRILDMGPTIPSNGTNW